MREKCAAALSMRSAAKVDVSRFSESSDRRSAILERMTLAMAPGYLIAQYCTFVDLDSPIYLPPEDAPNITYTGSVITWAPTRIWGTP